MSTLIDAGKLAGKWSGRNLLRRGAAEPVREPATEAMATTLWSIGDGPDWGWRIALSSPNADDLLVRMYVATPAGEEAPAVESRYARSTGGTREARP